MAFHNPRGRANYEPNSWGPDVGGPREDPRAGFSTLPEEADGPKVRLRPESFADHYSQARQFYVSQTLVEQRHIGDALVFELSKCEVLAIRTRMLGHLRNIDEDLAQAVADGLGVAELPAAHKPAVQPKTDLPPSDQLSILKRPTSFAGRKLGILVTDGANAEVLKALQEAALAIPAEVEVIAPTVGGVMLSDGNRLIAHHKIDGGPSVLFDAVALLVGEEGALSLLKLPPARDFVSDAYAHYKFIGFSEPALKLMRKVGMPDDLDDAIVSLERPADAKSFLKACSALRFWDRPDGV